MLCKKIGNWISFQYGKYWFMSMVHDNPDPKNKVNKYLGYLRNLLQEQIAENLHFHQLRSSFWGDGELSGKHVTNIQ